MSKEITNFIRSRFTIRQFDLNKKIPKKIIDEIILSGIHAPSACNVQGWRFVIVEDEQQKLSLINQGIDKLKNTPLGIFVFYTTQRVNKKYNDDFQSASACIENMLLEIHNQGLGACWVCDLPKKQVLNKILKVPKDITPIALIRIGFPINTQKKVIFPNFKLDEIVYKNKFNTQLHKKITKKVFNPQKLSFRLKRLFLSPIEVLKTTLKFIKNFFARL